MSSKCLIGKVIRVSGLKTLKVEVVGLVRHPIYQKVLKKCMRLLCDNRLEGIAVGDEVEIQECRKISKKKSWRVVKLIGR